MEVIVVEDDDDKEDIAQGDGQPLSPPQDDPAREDVPPPALGWTMKTYDKPGCDSSASHQRLVGILLAYYADWNASMEYVCNEYTHPLYNTYWKSRACIYIKDEEKGAYHHGG